MAHAFGIAFSLTGGVGGVEGTMAKPLNAGHAAHGGVRAALLARQGCTAPTAVLDAGHSFFDTFYPGADQQLWRLTADLGEHYHLRSPGIGLKAYPAGYYMHHSFEAALGLVTEHDLRAEDILSVRVGIRPGRHFNRPMPASVLDAKFSLQYMVAMAVLHRSLTIGSFAEDVVYAPATVAMLRKIEVYVDPGLPANQDITHNPVTIACADGRELSRTEPLPRSHWRRPVPRADWVGKFEANAVPALGPERAERVVAAFDDLGAVADVADLAALLRTP
jgi:2-methylcitrate dehydratase PrpD